MAKLGIYNKKAKTIAGFIKSNQVTLQQFVPSVTITHPNYETLLQIETQLSALLNALKEAKHKVDVAETFYRLDKASVDELETELTALTAEIDASTVKRYIWEVGCNCHESKEKGQSFNFNRCAWCGQTYKDGQHVKICNQCGEITDTLIDRQKCAKCHAEVSAAEEKHAKAREMGEAWAAENGVGTDEKIAVAVCLEHGAFEESGPNRNQSVGLMADYGIDEAICPECGAACDIVDVETGRENLCNIPPMAIGVSNP